MAEIRPFHGMMFGEHAGGDPSSLTCPPYDIILEDQRRQLLERCPHNIIRLELPMGESRYEQAGALLAQWQKEGVLKADEESCLYLYGEEFSVGGTAYSFTGIIARVRLEEFSAGVILPHEETLSKAKEDRFNLMEATGCNFSQIYTLYHDNEGADSTAAVVKDLTEAEPEVCFTDEEGVTHRLWRISDAAAIETLQRQFAPRKLYIADGHHRYETALRYRNTRGPLDRDAAEQFVMMFMVNMDNPGLVVFPTHRIVRGLEQFSAEELVRGMEKHFLVRQTDEAQQLLAEAYRAGKTAFVLCAGKQRWYVEYKEDGAIEAALPERSNAYRSLDVSVLHTLILEELLGIDKENMARQINLTYTRDEEEACALADSGEAQCAFLLNATRVEQIAAVAAAGEKMPQKSTYFYPKLITGLVMNCFAY